MTASANSFPWRGAANPKLTVRLTISEHAGIDQALLVTVVDVYLAI